MEKYQSSGAPNELLIDLHYLPCLDYMAGLLRFERVQLEAAEHYQKQSYRNRCYVLTANKVDCLTVPVLNGAHKQAIRDVRIDNQQSWQDRHWRCLLAAYNKAPFFEYYVPELEPIYRRNWTFLFDLNYELLTLCLGWLRVHTSIWLTDTYRKQVEPGVFDARNRLTGKQREQEPLFGRINPYPQNFGREFVPNLSIIDLLFCQGPEATQYLTDERTVK